MKNKPIIRIENLEKEFGKGVGMVQVLKGIDLEIFAGEFVVIFGPSGCGKSTLLNTITGLEKPTKGEVYLRDQEIYFLKEDERARLRHKSFGIIYQQAHWIRPLNIIENVALALNIGGFSIRRARERSRKALELFNVDKFCKNIPTELSGGQQQKVAMVRALVSNPWVILADEPTGNLDKTSADDIMYVFKSLNEEFKRTVIIVTHNPDYEKFATKVIRMDDGRIKSIKKISNVRVDPDGILQDVIFE